MKKLIALLLALLMVSSTVIAVSAEGANAATPPSAPIIRAAQPNDAGNAVRFLATVHSTLGTEVGFEVIANYTTVTTDGETETTTSGSVTYSKKVNETLDANMAGTTLYTSVKAAGDVYTLADIANGDETAIGIFAAEINGIPADTDIVFEVNTYVDYEGTTIKSATSYVKYVDGEILDMTGGKTSYSQDFTTAMTSAEALEAAGITKPYGQAMNPTFEGDKLNIPYTKWGKTDCFFGLVPRTPFAELLEENDDKETEEVERYNYMLEMDLDITQLHALSFIFNGSPDSTSDTNKYRPNSIYVSLRVPTVTAEGETWDGKFQKGLISTLEATGENILVRTGTYTSAGADAKVYNDTSDALDIADDAKNVELKLTIVVNNTHADGCQVGVFINGALVQSSVVADNYRVTANSYVSVWAEESVLSIDNVKVSKINGVITLDTANESDTLPTPENPKYNQTFTDIDPLEACNVTFPYKYQGDFTSNTCSGGFPVTINDAKQLQISSHAWHNNADYFAHLVSADRVDTADIYKFEADLNITTLGTFGFMINNDVDTDLADNYTEYQPYMLFVSFRNLAASDSTTGKAGLHFRIAHYNASGVQIDKQDILISETATTLDARFTLIVDSTDKGGCRLYLFLDNKLIDTVVYDNAYDVKDNSSIGIWAQSTVATIDNIKFTGVKKNN